MAQTKTMEKHAAHGFSQFRLTNDLLQNLNKFEITPTAKLVLLYLSSCYNPKKADMFPKQKTIAVKIGISEASVIRAISELHKQGLIISERKYTNRYKWTSKILPEQPVIEKIFESDNLQGENKQNESKNIANCKLHEHEQTKEQIKEPVKVDDFKILKQYAKDHKADDVIKYVNYLKRIGADKKIIADFKAKEASDRYFDRQIKETKQHIEQMKYDAQNACAPTKEWRELKNKLMNL